MTAPNQIRECDVALDYLYGMLDGEAKARFEAHLATCANCQVELESFGRVREVAKATLPAVEPSERLTGALHAQLMHAAGQRAETRGKVIPFLRRVVSHPGYAAAAGILIIGGAVGVQWSRGTLVMSAPKHESAEAAAPATPGVAAPAADTPEAPRGSLGAVAKDEKQLPVEAAKIVAKPAPPKPAIGAQPTFGVQPIKDAEGYAADKLADRDQPAKEKVPAVERRAKSDQADLRGGGLGSFSGKGGGGSAGLLKNSGGPPADATPPPATVAPSAPAKKVVAAPEPVMQAPAETSAAYGEAEQKPAPARAAKREESASHHASKAGGDSLDDLVNDGNAQRSQRNDSNGQAAPTQQATQQANAAADPTDNERRRAATLAQAGHCDEAVARYEALDKKSPERLSAQDRLTYVRCLRALGRLEPAQEELNQMRANRAALPGAALDAEQNALDVQRKRSVNKKAKKAAPAE